MKLELGTLSIREGGDHRVRKLLRACGAADVARDVLAFFVHFYQGRFDAFRRGPLAQVLEHQNRAHQQRREVRQSLARNVRRRAVHRLENRAFIANVPAGTTPNPPTSPAPGRS